MIEIDKKNGIANGRKKRSYGYSTLELLFYISLFAVLSLVVTNALLTMTKAFKETKIQSELSASGTIMERMSREIRQALGINFISATSLRLSTKDEAGADKTVEFLLSGPNVEFLENGVLTGNLNAPNLTITGLAFTPITTAEGQAVKVLLTIRSNNDSLNRSLNFYDTIVLRGDY